MHVALFEFRFEGFNRVVHLRSVCTLHRAEIKIYNTQAYSFKRFTIYNETKDGQWDWDPMRLSRDTNLGIWDWDWDWFSWDAWDLDKYRWHLKIQSFGTNWDPSLIWFKNFQNPSSAKQFQEFWLAQIRPTGHKSLGLLGLEQKSLGQSRDSEL